MPPIEKVTPNELTLLMASIEQLKLIVDAGFANAKTEREAIKKDLVSINNWKIATQATDKQKQKNIKEKETNHKWRDAFLVLLGVFVTFTVGILAYFSTQST